MPNENGPNVGVILAGGLARRMGGGDKPLVKVGGKPMLDWVVEGLSRQVTRVIINANGDPVRFSGHGLPVVADTIEGFAGPLAGILAGLQWTRTNLPSAKFVVSVAADTPFFPADLVLRLSRARGVDESAIALAASSDGFHPVFGLWPVSLVEDLDNFLRQGQSGKILAFVDRHPSVRAEFADVPLPGGGAADPFFNVNTPEDAAEADAIAAALRRAA